MKKIALMLLALILCLSLCLTGCDGDSTKQTTKPADPSQNGNNENNANTPTVTKKDAVDAFNSFDLSKLLENTNLSSDGVQELINELAVGADLTLKYDTDAIDIFDIAIKDGLLYTSRNDASNDKFESYIYFGDGSMTPFRKNEDGNWEKVESTNEELPDYDVDVNSPEEIPGYDIPVYMPTIDPNASTSTVAPLTNMTTSSNPFDLYLTIMSEYVSNLAIPKLTEADLSAKNGMYVLSNDYLLKLIKENIVAFSNESISTEELNATMEDCRGIFEALGLEISFLANDKALTKLNVAIDPDYESELLADMFDGEVTLTKANIYVETTADGMYLKKYEIKYTTDFSKYEKGFSKENVFALETKFGSDNKPSGMSVSIDAIGGESEWDGYDEETNTDTEYMIFLDVKANATVDFDKIGTTGADIANATLKLSPSKAFRVTTTYADDDYGDALSETIVPATLKEAGGGLSIDMSFSVKSEGANKISLKGNVTATADGKTNKVEVSGNLYLNNVLNFPTNIPAVITDYINGNTAA